MRSEKGFTIVEILILIAILMIIASMGLIPLKNKMEAYRIESDARAIQGLIQEFRMKAFTDKKGFKFKLKNSGKRACIEDSSNNEIRCVNLNKSWLWSGSTTEISISDRGTATGGTVYYNSGDIATLDCVVVSLTRVRAGKWNGSSCDVK